MRILYTHYLNDDNHPAARMVNAIAHELEDLGHTVLVHRCLGANGFDNPHKSIGPDVHNSSRSPLVSALKGRLWFARTLSDNLSSKRSDRLAIASFKPNVILAREDAYRTSIVQEAIKNKVPLVTYADAPVAYESRTFHSGKRWHPPGIVEYIEQWWIRSSKAVITPSHPSALELGKYKVPVPIHVIPNGVNPRSFPILDAEDKRRYRSDLGIPSNKTIIGFQGSFRNFHGIDLLCELIRSTAHRTDMHWVLVGDGPERYKIMEILIDNPAVTVLGQQSPDRMGSLVGIMDIGISTHVFTEGSFYLCPLKILEYASAGCAVIASAQGDIPGMLDNGRIGILVDSPDSSAWGKALNDLLNDQRRISMLGQSASQWVNANRTWRKTAEQILDVLNVITGHSPSHGV